ncbi:MAG TPA: glycosyltransferase [Azospirillaceae bacterium]|nr:glycosyltransferase [Azospirillaceae bacterium]
MTTLFVASNGGHLAQLHRLSRRMGVPAEDALWVTFDGAQARSLLAGAKTLFVPDIAERDVAGVLRAMGPARRLLRRPSQIRAVVSTGSAIALAFLPLAAAAGIAAHYIESAARVRVPSLTGRLLQAMPGVTLYRQYPWAGRGRWRYGGSVFDGFQVRQRDRREVRRIVVTIGSDRPFTRLLAAAAAILPPSATVLWQTGESGLDGLDIQARPFVPSPELDQAIREADVVIAHAGCGSALTALAAGKCPILVPRDPSRGEVVDDHQIEIARWLASRGLAIFRPAEALSPADLEIAAARSVFQPDDPPPFNLAKPAWARPAWARPA